MKQGPDLVLFRKLPKNWKQVTPLLTEEMLSEPIKDHDYLEDLCAGIKNYSQKIVFKYWLIALFPYSVSYAVPSAAGPERIGKSVLLKGAKSLFDPVEDMDAPIRDRPSTLAEELKTEKYKIDDVNLKIWQSSLVIWDNISKFTQELEDEFCLWITGGNHSKRMLYRNTEMIELSGSRAIGYTGISNVATRPDHIARIFNIDIELDQDKKKLDEEFWGDFYKDKPKTMTYIFKIISKMLANYEDMKKDIIKKDGIGETLPDFEMLCEVICRCMGYPDNTFHDAWESLRDDQVGQGIENSTVGTVLENYISDQFARCHLAREKTECLIEAKSAELLKTLKSHGKLMGLINEDNDFPKTPGAFARELYRLKRSFGHIGVKISSGERTNSRRSIIIDYNQWRDRAVKNQIKTSVNIDEEEAKIDAGRQIMKKSEQKIMTKHDSR